jgi:hypothetical protein
MKAAVLIAHYNKNDHLRNTLAGIARQVTTFPFEVCIIDDHSEVDPVNIVEEQLWGKSSMMSYKYKRLDKNITAMYSHGKCMDLVSDDVDILVVMSCDVIMIDTNIIEELCKRVEGKQIVTAEVRDVIISPNTYKDFDTHTGAAMKHWGSSRTYSNPIRMYLFLSAVKRDVLEATKFSGLNCDMVVHSDLGVLNCKHIIYQDLRAIHQHHKDFIYPCPIVEECTFPCMRKKNYSSSLKARRRKMEHPK